MLNLRTGAPVYTSDGDKLGTVSQISGDTFKLDVSGQPDYWLSTDEILTSEIDRIAMRFNKDHLGDYKLDKPAARSL
jgi:hypothetical protein